MKTDNTVEGILQSVYNNKEVYIVIYYTCDDSFHDEYRLVFDGIEKVFNTKEKAEAYINKDICKHNFRIIKMKVE